MKSISLPFTIDVEMLAYHNKAFPLGVMKANLQNYDSWICNKLINSMYRLSDSFDVCNRDLWSEEEGLVLSMVMHMTPDAFNNKGIDILKQNKLMLREGYYITGDYNEYFIKGKMSYQRNDYNHDYIIFGYDDEKSIFKSAGYLADGSYKYFDIDYESYYKSIVGYTGDRMYVQYRCINREYEPAINVALIKEKLCSYLNSQKDYVSLRPDAYCYGVKVWEKLIEYVTSIGEKKLDCRFCRVFMEHKKIMTMRLEKLYEAGFLNDSSIVEVYHRDVAAPTQVIHILFMKYNITRNAELLSRIINIITKVNACEQTVLKKVIESL